MTREEAREAGEMFLEIMKVIIERSHRNKNPMEEPSVALSVATKAVMTLCTRDRASPSTIRNELLHAKALTDAASLAAHNDCSNPRSIGLVFSAVVAAFNGGMSFEEAIQEADAMIKRKEIA